MENLSRQHRRRAEEAEEAGDRMSVGSGSFEEGEAGGDNVSRSYRLPPPEDPSVEHELSAFGVHKIHDLANGTDFLAFPPKFTEQVMPRNTLQ